MAAPASGLIITVAIQLLFVLIVVRRSYQMSKGVSYSTLRVMAVPVLLLLLWALSEYESTVLAPWAIPYLIALDAGIVAAAAWWFAPIAQRATQFFQGESGDWRFRIDFSVTAVFLVAYLVRLAIADVLFPASLSFGGGPPAYP